MAVSEGDVLRVAVRMQGTQSQDVMNIWHVRCTTLVSGDNDDVADDLVDALSNNYQDLEPAVANTQIGSDMSIQNVSNSEVLGTHLFSPAFGGDLTGDEMPPQTSLFSIFRTGFARRIGRKFWGICSESHVDAGLVDSTIISQMGTLIGNFLSAFVGVTSGNTYYFGIYNDNMGISFVDFSEGVFKSRLMIQRRRRPQVGS